MRVDNFSHRRKIISSGRSEIVPILFRDFPEFFPRLFRGSLRDFSSEVLPPRFFQELSEIHARAVRELSEIFPRFFRMFLENSHENFPQETYTDLLSPQFFLSVFISYLGEVAGGVGVDSLEEGQLVGDQL